MNGKKAKLIRKLAGHQPSDGREYHPVQSTARERIMKDLEGKVVARYQTVTFQLSAGTRITYKMLKKHYQQRILQQGVFSR